MQFLSRNVQPRKPKQGIISYVKLARGERHEVPVLSDCEKYNIV